MKSSKNILLLLTVIMSSLSLYAQEDTVTVEGMKWYLTRAAAFDAAEKECKQVVLVWGGSTCPNTANVRSYLSTVASLQSLVDKYYILWYADPALYGRRHEDLTDYIEKYVTIPYPVVGIINTDDAQIAKGITWGPRSAAELETQLNAYKERTVDIYKDMTWYLTKAGALNAARTLEKSVIMLWGDLPNNSCDSIKDNLANDSLRSVIDEHYVLWFSNRKFYDWGNPEIRDYIPDSLKDQVELPIICLLDSFNNFSSSRIKYVKYGDSYISFDSLSTLLNNHVDNEAIAIYKPLNDSKVFISNGNLVIQNAAESEIISVYTLTGTLIDSFVKRDNYSGRDTSRYPKGILIISGSSGWARKIIK